MLKIGDRVIVVKEDPTRPKVLGEKGVVRNINKGYSTTHLIEFDKDIGGHDGNTGEVRVKSGHGWWVSPDNLAKEGKEMELRQKIEAIEAWDKDADDILQELCEETRLRFWIETYTNGDSVGGCVIIAKHGTRLETVAKGGHNTDIHEASFSFYSQCSKLEAFKDGLLWLAEKADKLEPKLVGKEVKAEIDGKIYKVRVLEKV